MHLFNNGTIIVHVHEEVRLQAASIKAKPTKVGTPNRGLWGEIVRKNPQVNNLQYMEPPIGLEPIPDSFEANRSSIKLRGQVSEARA